jgi:hypothetical protein
MKIIKQLLSKQALENETEFTTGFVLFNPILAKPFLAYQHGRYCVFNKKMGGFHTDPRLCIKMIRRAKKIEFIDISDKNLFVDEMVSNHVLNFKSLLDPKVYPNGLFILLLNLNKDELIVNSPLTCLEIFRVQDELRLGLFHFYDIQESFNRRYLTLEASYSVNLDGSLKEKFLFSAKDEKKSRGLFDSYLRKFLAFHKTTNQETIFRNIVLSNKVMAEIF